MIILKTLKWDNCFSYGAGNVVELHDSTLTQVLGTNGVGKSSIPVILEEVLYNKNSKGIKKSDIPNRNINKGYNISLSFSKEEDEYQIFVERNANIKVKFIKNGEDISSHTATNTYKSIQDVIGVDFKTFSQIVYQNTNTSLQFLTATDTNRKKFLIDLLNLDNYVQYFELFKTAAKDTALSVAELQGQSDTVTKWLQNNKLDGMVALPLLELPNSPEEEEKELRSLLVEIKNISQKNKKIRDNNQYKKLLASINIAELQSSPYKEIKSYDEEQAELGSIKAEFNRLKKSIEKMESLGDVCHTCEQEISSEFKQNLIDTEKSQLAGLKEKGETLSKKISEIQRFNLEVQKVSKQTRDWEELYKSIDDDLPSDILDEQTLSSQATALEAAIKIKNKKIAEVNAENQKRTSNNTRIEVIKEQQADFESKKQEYDAKLLEKQDDLAHLEILKKAFSTNGLIAYKIENLVKELEELTNKYLAELSDGRFTLGFVVSNDKLNVEITDNGNTVDILSLSSGELARVNTSTLLAIRRLMSSISHSKLNVLFLDEVISVLDDQGKEKLVEVLLEEEDLNSYLISHGWTHPLLTKIEVVKHGNTSSLEV